jgi:hypothetical protein
MLKLLNYNCHNLAYWKVFEVEEVVVAEEVVMEDVVVEDVGVEVIEEEEDDGMVVI